MTRQLRIGFDVGGTFTDGVLMEEREVLAKGEGAHHSGCDRWNHQRTR